MNQAMEHNLDKIMDRTSDRPIPSGRVEEMEAKALSIICASIGLLYLYVMFPKKPLVTVPRFLLSYHIYVFTLR